MRAAVIIVAAGKGRRFGSKIPKQFLLCAGKPVFLWSLLVFKQIKDFKQIILVVPKNWLKKIRCFNSIKDVVVVSGGEERKDSVKQGLKSLDKDIEYVAIHDAVRPLINRKLVNKILYMARLYGACVPAIRVRDTIKIADKDMWVEKTVPRSNLYQIQTPQIFRRDLIEKAYNMLNVSYFTDDAQVVESVGVKVKLIDGNISNIKITEKKDLKIAELLLKHRY